MDVNARIDVAALRTLLEACLDAQRAVYAVVAIIGSTEEGSVDPLDDILALYSCAPTRRREPAAASRRAPPSS